VEYRDSVTHQCRQYYGPTISLKEYDHIGVLSAQVYTPPASEYAITQDYASRVDSMEFDSSDRYGTSPTHLIPTRNYGSNNPFPNSSRVNYPQGAYFGFGPSTNGRVPIPKSEIAKSNYQVNVYPLSNLCPSPSSWNHPIDADNGLSKKLSISPYALMPHIGLGHSTPADIKAATGSNDSNPTSDQPSVPSTSSVGSPTKLKSEFGGK
jgi:hypothetical protein